MYKLYVMVADQSRLRLDSFSTVERMQSNRSSNSILVLKSVIFRRHDASLAPRLAAFFCKACEQAIKGLRLFWWFNFAAVPDIGNNNKLQVIADFIYSIAHHIIITAKRNIEITEPS